MFQRDCAPIHSAQFMFEWFLSNGVPIIDWPTFILDLNHIENLSGTQVRVVI